MRVEVNLFATLARYLPDEVRQGDHMVELSDGTTMGELLQRLQIPSEEAKLMFVDGVRADADSVLREGSRIGIFPPIGGG